MKPTTSTGNTSDDLLPVWKALADPCRRRILDLLRERPLRTGDLAERFDFTRFGVMKHLGVLTEAGLVVVRRKGRERWNYLNPIPIQRIARRWIRPYEAVTADALLRLKDMVEQEGPEEQKGEADMATVLESGFRVQEVQLQVRMRADREKVWKALTEGIGHWWPSDFLSHPEARGFVLEPRIGGRLYEDWGDGQGATFATIMKIRHKELLQCASDLDGGCGGPGRTYVTMKLTEEDGETVMDVHDVTWGRVTEEGREETEKGWRYLMEDCMKPFVEGGAPS